MEEFAKKHKWKILLVAGGIIFVILCALIGFGVELWDEQSENESSEYLVYRWENGHFQKVLTQKTRADQAENSEKVRGVYAGTRFYCIYPEGGCYQVKSFDMEDNFKKLDTLQL